jgi:hypothetical protein
MPIVQVLLFNKCYRGICRYIFFIRKSLYSLCLYINSFSVLFLTSARSLTNAVFTYDCCLFNPEVISMV